jgi:hypothetical protein
MMSDSAYKAKKCCSTARKSLMKDIRVCDMCSSNWHEHHACLSRAAKRSGRQARSCMID